MSGYTSQWCRCKERCNYTSRSVHLHLHAMHINMYTPRPKWSAYSGHCRAPCIYTASESRQLQCALMIHWSSPLKFQGPLNLHCIRIRVATVCTPDTLILEAYPELFSVGTEVSSVAVYRCTGPTLQPTSVHFQCCTEDSKQSTFSAALQIPWNYTDPALHFDGG